MPTGSTFQAEHRFMRAADRRHFVGDFQINAHAFTAQQISVDFEQ